ncbi:MAG: NmrA family NAD(P)-binding protein [Mycobacterium sp.]
MTAATGNTGAPTVRNLLSTGHRVRALVHRVDARSDALAAAGAEVVVGDLPDFHADGYVATIVSGEVLRATAVFARAASDAGVQAVVNTSEISARRDAKSNSVQQHWIAERLLDRPAFITTHLRPTFFAEWLTWQFTRDGDAGVLQLPFANGRHAPISASDQAAVIASIVQDPALHDRQIYQLVGPVELDHYGIAAEIGSTLRIPVRYEPVEIASFAAGLTARGRTDFFVQHISNVTQDYPDGISAGENNLVEVVSGHKAMTVTENDDPAAARIRGSTSARFNQQTVAVHVPGTDDSTNSLIVVGAPTYTPQALHAAGGLEMAVDVLIGNDAGVETRCLCLQSHAGTSARSRNLSVLADMFARRRSPAHQNEESDHAINSRSRLGIPCAAGVFGGDLLTHLCPGSWSRPPLGLSLMSITVNRSPTHWVMCGSSRSSMRNESTTAALLVIVPQLDDEEGPEPVPTRDR